MRLHTPLELLSFPDLFTVFFNCDSKHFPQIKKMKVQIF